MIFKRTKMEYNSSEIVLFIYLFNLSNRMEVEKKYVGLCILQVYIAAKKRGEQEKRSTAITAGYRCYV